MNAAELMAALNTVEQDHQLVLEKLQGLKEMVACLADPAEVDLHQVLGRLREIDKYFATQLLSHMEEEEVTLFPLLETGGAEGAALAARLRHEHEVIRRRLEEFESCLDVAGQLEEGRLPRAVLRDLLSDSWGLWEVLHDHAHVETQAVQQFTRRFLTPDAAP
jgi:iron-sulfur cluster repair protein YtfE (RIC family)